MLWLVRVPRSRCRPVAPRCLRGWTQVTCTLLLEDLVPGALPIASPHRDGPVAALERLGGAGPRAAGPIVAGDDHRERGLCVDELVAAHGVARAEGSVRAVGGKHHRAAVVHGPADLGSFEFAQQRLGQDPDDCSTGLEGCIHGELIDAAGAPRHQRQAPPGRKPGNLLGHLASFEGHITAADHSQSRCVEQLKRTVGMYQRRRLGSEPIEPLARVVLVEDSDGADAGLVQPLQLKGQRGGPAGERTDAASQVLGQAATRNESLHALTEYQTRILDVVDQAPELRRLEWLHALRAQAANQQDRGQRVILPHRSSRLSCLELCLSQAACRFSHT